MCCSTQSQYLACSVTVVSSSITETVTAVAATVVAVTVLAVTAVVVNAADNCYTINTNSAAFDLRRKTTALTLECAEHKLKPHSSVLSTASTVHH
jgi:hypothetical protein